MEAPTELELRVTPGHDNTWAIIVYATANPKDKARVLELGVGKMAGSAKTPKAARLEIVALAREDLAEWATPTVAATWLPAARATARLRHDAILRDKAE